MRSEEDSNQIVFKNDLILFLSNQQICKSRTLAPVYLFRYLFFLNPHAFAAFRSALTPPYNCKSRRMKNCAVRSAISVGTQMSNRNSPSVGTARDETFSPKYLPATITNATSPGGVVMVMPCLNPNPNVPHAAALATRCPFGLIARMILHPNQFDSKVGEVIINSNGICLLAARLA